MQASKPHLRDDIQSLRAIAVLLVIFNHSKIPFFDAGFIGVDIFFVISGYLISNIVYSQTLAKHFSFVDFYTHRTRRILPALFATLIGTSIVAIALMIPTDLVSFGSSLAYASGFSSNFYFAKTTSYFETTSTFLPLLHTWSLAIEEQFYLVFPVLLFCMVRWIPQRIKTITITLLIISLLLCLLGSRNFPDTNFFNPITRAWEFLLGFYLILYRETFSSARFQKYFNTIGYALILFSLCIINEQTTYPSLITLLPTVGAAFILASDDRGVLKAIFANRAMVYIGTLSYSLYLIHFPVLAFSHILQTSDTANLSIESTLIIIFLLSAVLYYGVETPLRYKFTNISQHLILAVTVIITITFVCLGVLITRNADRLHPYSSNQLAVLKAFDSPSYSPDWDTCSQHAPCYGGDLNGTQKVILWGDSHAYTLFPALSEYLKDQGTKLELYTDGNCPPVFTTDPVLQEDSCIKRNLSVYQKLLNEPHPVAVILMARWAWYTLITPSDNGVGGAGKSRSIFLSKYYNESLRANYFKELLEHSLKQVKQTGTSLIIINTVPEPGWNVKSKSLYLDLTPSQLVNKTTYPLDRYKERNATPDSIFSTFKGEDSSNIWIVHPSDFLCPQPALMCTQWQLDDMLHPSYMDDNHLTIYGAQLLMPAVAALLTSIRHPQ